MQNNAESEVINDSGDSNSSLESVNTQPICEGLSLRDVAEAALYGNIDVNVPGFARPNKNEANDVVNEAKLKFMVHLKRDKPIGWTHYDVIDLSQDLTKLFIHEDDDNNDDQEDSDDDVDDDDDDDHEVRYEHQLHLQRLSTVRRKLFF